MTISPYRGGKQNIDVAGDLSVEKRRDEDLVITIRGTAHGMEVVALQ